MVFIAFLCMVQFVDSAHEFVAGMNRMGKSMWVIFKLIQSMLTGCPFVYIDPKGDNYPKLLSWLAFDPRGQRFYQENHHRIIFVNPVAKADYLVGGNVIEPLDDFLLADPDRISLLAASLTAHIKRVSGYDIGMAARMESAINASIGLLVQRGKGAYSLDNIFLIFTKGEGQQTIFNPWTIQQLYNQPEPLHFGTKLWFVHEYAQWNPNDRKAWIASMYNQILRLVFDERALFTLCTTENATLNWQRVVEDRCWVFINLPFQYMGSEDITTLVGDMFISKLFLACMQYNPNANPIRLVIDEARLFNTAPLEKLLDMGATYGLYLTLIIQTLSQLVRSPQGSYNYALYDAVLTNCRYWAVFNTMVKDAAVFSEEMFGLTGLMPRDIWQGDYLPAEIERNQYVRRLSTLPKRQMYLYDKHQQTPRIPQWWETPDVTLPQYPPAQLAMFEAEHLRKTGRLKAEIAREIYGRYSRIMEIVNTQPEKEKKTDTPPHREEEVL